jgi:hypothetical protein
MTARSRCCNQPVTERYAARLVSRALRAAGMPAGRVEGLLEDYVHYVRGEAETVSPQLRDVTGVEPGDLKQFATDYARAFVGA